MNKIKNPFSSKKEEELNFKIYKKQLAMLLLLAFSSGLVIGALSFGLYIGCLDCKPVTASRTWCEVWIGEDDPPAPGEENRKSVSIWRLNENKN